VCSKQLVYVHGLFPEFTRQRKKQEILPVNETSAEALAWLKNTYHLLASYTFQNTID
jgi:hypothetical protein